jgi:hypothetical protein
VNDEEEGDGNERVAPCVAKEKGGSGKLLRREGGRGDCGCGCGCGGGGVEGFEELAGVVVVVVVPEPTLSNNPPLLC